MTFSTSQEFDRLRVAFNSVHDFDLSNHLLVLARVGSVAYNTHVSEQSDLDLMGVVVPPPQYLIGLRTWEHWVRKIGDDLDVKFFSLQKFTNLLLKSNPSVLEMLWIPPEQLLVRSRQWDKLLQNKDRFSSLRAYNSFVGYARDQLKAIRQSARDRKILFEVEEELAFRERDGQVWDFFDYTTAELEEFRTGLAGRIKTRDLGAKRKADVDRLGFDPKNAGHAVRLLRMGVEFLESGEMKVFRDEDADYLRNIRLGLYTLDDIDKEVERLQERAITAHEFSKLPVAPDQVWAEKYLMEVHREVILNHV